MATRTISAAGGNWNSTSTWVEGIVPVSGDLVVGNSSSGNLTMNTAVSVGYIVDFTNYSATWSFNVSGVYMPTAITGQSTSTFSSTMTIAYNNVNNTVNKSTGGASTYVFLGSGTNGEFPTLFHSSGTINVTGLMKINTLSRSNQAVVFNRTINNPGYGTMSLVKYMGFAPSGGNTMTGTLPFVFDRASGEFSNSNLQLNSYVSNPIIINTPGTFTITANSGSYGFISLASNGSLTHIQGTIAGQKNIHITNANSGSSTQVSQTATLDVASAGTWSSVRISDTSVNTYTPATTQNTISLTSDLYFDDLRLEAAASTAQYYGGRDSYRIITRITGNGRLKGGYIYGETSLISRSPTTGEIAQPFYEDGTAFLMPRLQLSTGTPSHQLTGIRMNGLSYAGSSASYAQLASITPGTKAFVNITTDPNTFGVWFRDIDASGGLEVKNYFGDTTDSINISNQASLPTPGGGGGGSFTFVN